MLHSIAVKESKKGDKPEHQRSVLTDAVSTRSKRAHSTLASIDGGFDSVLEGSVAETRNSAYATEKARREHAQKSSVDYSNTRVYNKLTKTRAINPGCIIPQPIIDFAGGSMLEPRYGSSATSSGYPRRRSLAKGQTERNSMAQTVRPMT